MLRFRKKLNMLVGLGLIMVPASGAAATGAHHTTLTTPTLVSHRVVNLAPQAQDINLRDIIPPDSNLGTVSGSVATIADGILVSTNIAFRAVLTNGPLENYVNVDVSNITPLGNSGDYLAQITGITGKGYTSYTFVQFYWEMLS